MHICGNEEAIEGGKAYTKACNLDVLKTLHSGGKNVHSVKFMPKANNNCYVANYLHTATYCYIMLLITVSN